MSVQGKRSDVGYMTRRGLRMKQSLNKQEANTTATVDKNATEEDYLLELRDLKKHFDVSQGFFSKDKQYLKAVGGIDLKIRRGETLGLVGESGCGKSTTGNTIIRLLEVTDGQVI